MEQKKIEVDEIIEEKQKFVEIKGEKFEKPSFPKLQKEVIFNFLKFLG